MRFTDNNIIKYLSQYNKEEEYNRTLFLFTYMKGKIPDNPVGYHIKSRFRRKNNIEKVQLYDSISLLSENPKMCLMFIDHEYKKDDDIHLYATLSYTNLERKSYLCVRDILRYINDTDENLIILNPFYSHLCGGYNQSIKEMSIFNALVNTYVKMCIRKEKYMISLLDKILIAPYNKLID